MTHRIRILIPVSLILITTLLASCRTAPVAMAPSNTPLLDRKVEANLGKTSGSHSVWSLFGIWMFGRPDVEEAVKSAVTSKQGDALINVKCYQSIKWFIFFTIDTVTVEGEAVLLGREKEKEKKKK
jgi:hypothetical protein